MPKRFLISRLSALGDVVCTLPAADALKRSYPDCHITWVCDPRFAEVAECCTAVDTVIRAKPGFSKSTWPKFDEDFDAAFDLQGLLKSALVVKQARAKAKLGYHWQREGAQFFSNPVRPDPTSLHIVDQYVDVVRAAGADAGETRFCLQPKPEHLASLEAKITSREIVVLNAGAGWITKRWPPAFFAEVANWLTGASKTPILIGGPSSDDRAVAAEVHAAAPDAVNLVGQTSIGELIALISRSRAHLGGDTGSTHITAALGVPAIGLYSITKPERSCPYGQIRNCLYNPAGLDKITPSMVIEKLEVAFA